MLEQIAGAYAIDWPAARSQMIDGDAEAGAAQLAADKGDGIEVAGVVLWLQLLAGRAPAGVSSRRDSESATRCGGDLRPDQASATEQD